MPRHRRRAVLRVHRQRQERQPAGVGAGARPAGAQPQQARMHRLQGRRQAVLVSSCSGACCLRYLSRSSTPHPTPPPHPLTPTTPTPPPPAATAVAAGTSDDHGDCGYSETCDSAAQFHYEPLAPTVRGVHGLHSSCLVHVVRSAPQLTALYHQVGTACKRIWYSLLYLPLSAAGRGGGAQRSTPQRADSWRRRQSSWRRRPLPHSVRSFRIAPCLPAFIFHCTTAAARSGGQTVLIPCVPIVRVDCMSCGACPRYKMGGARCAD